MVEKAALRNRILNEYPYPIAVRYKAMLEETSPETKARLCVSIYEAGLRALTLGVVGQYIQRDLDIINDETLNNAALKLISTKIAPALGTWKNVFFNALKAYGGHRDRFFMAELYDFYWDTSADPHRVRKGIQRPFQRIVELRNEISHAPPTDPTIWRTLYEEIDGHLHHILNLFLFLADYDLVYIVEQTEKGYIYDIYTGQKVHRDGVLQTEKPLKEGWCYLSKITGEFLPVHPLIIFWEDELNLGDLHIDPEVVVYDSRKVQRLKYWHSSAGRLETENAGLLDIFIGMIVERLESQRPQQEVFRLSWANLRSLSQAIVAQRMGNVRRKYKPKLYLQRQDTRETFNEFLQSEKTCLILTGNSGVGKSNFLFSLIDEFSESEKEYALAYNGASLAPDLPLETVLAQDFNFHLKFQGGDTPDGLTLLRMIDEIRREQKQQVIIFVDAINESPDGKELLRNINRFVENLSYPWLKVVVTSRPEAWRNIKRGIPLAEHKYFRQQGKDELGAEITGFDYVVRVDPFAYAELPQVYEKYRKAYRLTTPYEEISAPLKRQLRDPLTLLLVSETHKDSAIPTGIRTSELIEKYIKKLVETERLDKSDLFFLQHEIVPRLFQPPFRPRLMPEDIEYELTTDGRSLYEQIFNRDLLPSGRQVNQAYTNLADCGILIEQDSELDHIIGFEYERFYEYFGGVYLSRAAHETDNPFEYYRNLSGFLDDKPYLWGALKNALFTELKKGNVLLIHKLAQIVSSSDRLLRNAVVSSLVEFSEIEEEAVAVSILVNDMTQPLHGPAHSIIETTKRLLFRKRYDAIPLKPEQAIAIEVASRLGFEGLLIKAATDRAHAIRQAAILHIFYLWRNDSEAGYRIMRQLSEHAVAGWGLPDLGVIDALTSLTISTITYDHLNSAVQEHTLQVGRRVLRKLLFLNPEEHRTVIGRLRFLIWSQIRRPLLSFAINWGLKIIASWEADDLPANTRTLSNFFTLSEDDKELATLLVPFINPYKPGLSKYVEEIMAIEDIGDLLAMNMAQQTPLITRAQVNFDDALTTLYELIDQRLNQGQPIPWMDAYSWIATQIALRQTSLHPKLFEIVERCTKSIQSDPRKWLAAHKTLSEPWLNTLAAGIVSYMVLNYLLNGTAMSPLCRNWIDRAVEDKDVEYLRDYLKELKAAFDMGFHKVALQGLEAVAGYPHPQIQQDIGELLIRIRQYFPEDVENILLQEVFPESISRRVWSSSPAERVNDLLGLRAIGIFYDLFLLGPEILRQETIWIASQARKMPDLESFVALLIKEMLNLAVNEVIFPIPEDSPSKLLLAQK